MPKNENGTILDESEIICYYYTGEEPHDCPGPMGDERHYVIKGGELVLAHRRCQKRASEGVKKVPTPEFPIIECNCECCGRLVKVPRCVLGYAPPNLAKTLCPFCSKPLRLNIPLPGMVQ